MFKNAVLAAADNITLHKNEVDALNVFPVPDGDTGTNMSMTMNAAAREAALIPDDADISLVAERTASALLRGARGNSGVILSLIFRGFAKGLKGCAQASASDLSAALTLGTETAYKAVMKPTEGTILTVIRMAAEKAHTQALAGREETALWDDACEAAAIALEKTPEQLPVLKKAGVVDAGGQGLVYIMEGMAAAFGGSKTAAREPGAVPPEPALHHAASADMGSSRYTYCTEFVIDSKGLDAQPLRSFLENIGDSVLVASDDNIIKVHVHTDEPAAAMQEAQKYGKLLNVKIENMVSQHEEIVRISEERAAAEEAPAAPEKRFGIVAVASGEGIRDLFTDIGADAVVSGGQTMNPSTEDILKAVNGVPAELVFVLPNNKNIIMTAEQVIPLTGKKVRVIHTRSIPQGLAAAISLDESASAEENHLAMNRASEKAVSGLVTYAARDSALEDRSVRKGEILGLINGKIVLSDSSPLQAAYRVTRQILRKGGFSQIAVMYGAETPQKQAAELEQTLKAKFGGEADISLINGGQPLYYYIIWAE